MGTTGIRNRAGEGTFLARSPGLTPSSLHMNTYPSETVDIDEAAALMNAQTDTVQQIARRGELPGAKIGKAWVFMRADVLAYVQKKIDGDTAERRRNVRSSITMCNVVVQPPRGRSKPRPVLPDLPSITRGDPPNLILANSRSA